MNLRPSLSTARGAALACALLAGLVALRWLLRFELGASVPGLAETSLVAAMLLLIGSMSVWYMAGWPTARAPNPGSTRVLRWLALGMSMLPALMLLEAVLDVSLGVDIAHPDVLPTALNPHPGRSSPNACIAFLLLFASLGLLAGAPGRRTQRLCSAAIGTALLIAVMGVLGYLLRLEQLYHWGNLNRMTLVTALGLMLLAIALWDQQLRWSGLAARMDLHERRITWRSMAVLSVVAVAAGAGGFAALEVEFERARKEDIRFTAFITGEALTHTLDAGIWLSNTIATRPVVIEQLARLGTNAGDAEARERLRAITRSLLTGGITATRFLDPANRPLTEAGRPAVTPTMPALSLAQQHAPNARIVWAGGYVLLTDLPVMDRGQLVGIFQAEHRLSLMDRLVARVRDTDPSADVILCTRVADRVSCLPSKLHPEPANVPMFDSHDQPYLPISRALIGESGVVVTPDARGIQVVASYVPLGRTGLGMVVKTDAAAVFGALRQRLGLLALLLASLVLAGTWMLRRHVRPLVQQLASEQARYRAILDNSNDAFIGLNGAGDVSDWNLQAERMFGYTGDEARGRRLSELIIPPEARAAHDAGMARFCLTGTGRVVNQRIEQTALHRDGHTLDVELSVAAMPQGDGYVANAFLRDIGQRKAAARQLAASEQRMRDITNSIPAMVGVFDAQERCVYANDLALKVHGISRDMGVGMLMREGLGAASYALHESHVRAVLKGHAQTFEGTLPWRNGMGHFQVHLVPMRDALSDAVTGFYLMTFDITELRSAQLQQQRSEHRLRAIADNLPVLISYIDRDQRLGFVNKTFQEWMGVEPLKATGVHLKTLLGPELYAQRQPALERALAGERQEFEITSTALGITRHLKVVYEPDRQADGSVAGVFGMSADITVTKQAEQRLLELAHVDALTGLPNRREFESRLQLALARARRQRQAMAVIFMDVDHFKLINDGHGHAVGDVVLKEFGARIRAAIRATDTAARLAGDEFVVILEGLNSDAEASRVAAKLVDAIRPPMLLPGGGEIEVTTSVGMACWSGNGDGAQDILDRADRALYRAKAAGRDTFSQTTF
ncbi:PAS domain S-box protein [Roseateles asaccharophilus]|uniref:Diguanylate cyclase (GGDEF)-like protein/PAS domain S-box-containing protein n=1 Tax=Roseateles asaccharophilus TaxID=582607 RepID=A0ABU2AAX9_9BURK|nr:PAS domain S-box protein [Roseateles asaccharophilus]MDR7334358.1 diguanylate cyclase (GGDEF)-like protein/PAS domain S-box-containing protein [Roseateles asaccharophilus]